MRRRGGYSLIETLVVISVASTMLAVGVGLLHTLSQLDRQARGQMERRAALSRLADQFRRDVHAAARLTPLAARPGDTFPGWQLHGESPRTIEYRVRPGELVRSEQADGKVRSVESYRLPPGMTVSIQLDEKVKPPMASLRIAPDGKQSAEAGGVPLRIDAVLARDQRFVKAKGAYSDCERPRRPCVGGAMIASYQRGGSRQLRFSPVAFRPFGSERHGRKTLTRGAGCVCSCQSSLHRDEPGGGVFSMRS